MLTKDERILLDNCIDALNRLFDGDSSVIDLYYVMFATAFAFMSNPMGMSFEPAVRELREIAASNAPPREKRDLALLKTDYLRQQIAAVLRCDAAENPKQRHHPKLPPYLED